MVESKTFTTKLLRTVNYALLSILALSCLYPLWYTLCLSLSDKTAANSGMVTLWPINFTTISYREIMKESKFFHSFFISVQRTVLGSAFTTLVLVLFAVGVFSQTGYMLLVSLLFGGDASTVLPLLVLTPNVAT